MKVIITEKPSVARDIADVLKISDKHNGYLTMIKSAKQDNFLRGKVLAG